MECFGKNIKVGKGTRQGGLSSPFLFNLFYYDRIEMLASHEGGISIGDETFNVFAYADDILLASTTASGLQKLINSAVCYVENNGLCFNPKRLIVLLLGKIPLLMFQNGIFINMNC